MFKNDINKFREEAKYKVGFGSGLGTYLNQKAFINQSEINYKPDFSSPEKTFSSSTCATCLELPSYNKCTIDISKLSDEGGSATLVDRMVLILDGNSEYVAHA